MIELINRLKEYINVCPTHKRDQVIVSERLLQIADNLEKSYNVALVNIRGASYALKQEDLETFRNLLKRALEDLSEIKNTEQYSGFDIYQLKNR